MRPKGYYARTMHDFVIRGATVYDGLGLELVRDVFVTDGKIAEIGKSASAARKTVDAGGLALMPGIVDVHTHYDAQVDLGPDAVAVARAGRHHRGDGQLRLRHRALPRAAAPDRAAQPVGGGGHGPAPRWRPACAGRSRVLRRLPRQLRRIGPYANVAVLAQHSTIRSAVMGEEASTRAVPSDEQMAKMKALVARGDGRRRDRLCIVVLAQPCGLAGQADALDDCD